MNAKLIIVIIVIAIIILLLAIGGYYYWDSRKVSAESESMPISSARPSSSPTSDTKSVAPSTAPSAQSNTSTNSIPLSAPTTSAASNVPIQPNVSQSVVPAPTAQTATVPVATANGTKYTKSTNPSCVTTTGNGTFLTNTNGEWVGMPLDQAIDTCAKTSNLGGHGKCLGIMPTGMTAQPWTGCLSVDNREGKMAYLLTN